MYKPYEGETARQILSGLFLMAVLAWSVVPFVTGF
jgi:hypothetical protein